MLPKHKNYCLSVFHQERTYSMETLSVILFFTFGFWHCGSASTRLPDNLKLNYGVAFTETHKELFPSASAADLVFHAPAPSIPDKVDTAFPPLCPLGPRYATASRYFQVRCMKLSLWQQKLKKSIALVSNQVSTFNRTLTSLLETHTLAATNRGKRGLFDFVGDLSSKLFGTATKKQVNKEGARQPAFNP